MGSISDPKLRLLVVPGYYGFGARAPSRMTGSGIFFRDQALALALSGHDVTVIYVHFDSERGVAFEVVEDEQVRCLFVHASPWVKFNSIQRIILMVRAVAQIVPAERPQLVHVHTFLAVPVGWVLSRIFHIPFVVTEHSSKVRQGTVRREWRLIARWGYSKAGALVAVSQPLARALARYTDRTVVVVPNLVREVFFHTPLQAKSSSQPFTFLSIGYCNPVKGWDILIRSFSKIEIDEIPPLLLLVGGVCPDLVMLASLLGVAERVKFIAKVPPDEVAAVMASSDCHVMPSRVETFGIATVEALAAGKPAIMTATDAAESIIDSKNGLIVPIDDVDALAEAMKTMINTYGNYEPLRIRRSCHEKFSGNAVTTELAQVYYNCIEQEGRRKSG